MVAGFAIWFLVTGSFDPTAVKILGSTAVTSLCAVGGLVGATLLEREDSRRGVGLVTILLAAVDLALALAAIWSLSGSEAFFRALGAVSVLLPACVHACLMLGRVRPRDGRAVRGLSGAAVAFAMSGALILAGAFAFATSSPGDWFLRLLGVLAVLATLATLLAPIVRRLDRDRSRGRGAPVAPGAEDTPGAGRAEGARESQLPPAPRRPRNHSLTLGLDGAGR